MDKSDKKGTGNRNPKVGSLLSSDYLAIMINVLLLMMMSVIQFWNFVMLPECLLLT